MDRLSQVLHPELHEGQKSLVLCQNVGVFPCKQFKSNRRNKQWKPAGCQQTLLVSPNPHGSKWARGAAQGWGAGLVCVRLEAVGSHSTAEGDNNRTVTETRGGEVTPTVLHTQMGIPGSTKADFFHFYVNFGQDKNNQAVVAHTFDPSTYLGSRVQDQPHLQSESQVSQGYTVIPCLEKTKIDR